MRLPAHQRFDWLGSLTFVVGLGSLLLALSLIVFPMPPMDVVYGLFALAVVGLVSFVLVEIRAPEPMLDPRLFGDRLFAFASLAAARRCFGCEHDVPDALHAFEQGLHQAFLVSFGITLVAALASAFRPSHSPREAAALAGV